MASWPDRNPFSRFPLRLPFALWLAFAAPDAAARQEEDVGRGDLCVTCHFGIEDMHPWEPLSCTDCHGGDGTAETRERAHVRPARPLPNDERVLPLDFDPAFLRFLNPTNLRVVRNTCGACHEGVCDDLFRSLHATTAGHLCDGMYECGILKERRSRFGMFAVAPAPADDDAGDSAEHVTDAGVVEQLAALPSFDPRLPRDEFATHYRDLPPKMCARCHLWSRGTALRGRLGLDGDYRSEGCAACHVLYADDGLSKSGDPTVDRFEPGHPLRHELTTAIPTSTCTHCHYGDASIGLNFRGLAQLHPGQPAGPQVPGTTDARLNGTFYQNDPAETPPDVHHERGMHCIDCHTVRDVMGDGRLVGRMESAVEIECEDCHGTFERPTRGLTSRGRRIENLVIEEGGVFLVSKVTGKRHRVKQAAHVVNPRHPDFSPRAQQAMTEEHARLECYACHGAWSPNFFGFHFDRNEQFTQLDMMTGERTPGRVTTQEKVFSTFRGLYLGWNSEGRIAPFMVGFSSMGTVHDERGDVLLDQVMPVTAAGLSGMTLIHHQLHTTRPQARDCADCHRNPTALGLGSPNANFRLVRQFLFVGSLRGVEVVALDRKTPADSLPLATAPVLGVRGVQLEVEPLQGFAHRAFVSAARRGLAVFDLSEPVFPRRVGFLHTEDPHRGALGGDRFYLADGKGGVAVIDVRRSDAPRLLRRLPIPDARDAVLHGTHLYVADYEIGLVVVDVSGPRPRVVGRAELFDQDPAGARDVALLVLPSRPDDGSGEGRRSPLRVLAALACGTRGLRVVDVTEPERPRELRSFGLLGGRRGLRGVEVTAVAAFSKVDLGSPDGAIATEENDYFAVTAVARDRSRDGRLLLVRASDPMFPKIVDEAPVGRFAEDVCIANAYNPPFLQTFAFVAGGEEVVVIDLTRSNAVERVASFRGWRGASALAVEAMPLDRLVDESGRPWKDISHEGARTFTLLEIQKILRAPIGVGPAPLGPTTPAPQGDAAGSPRRSDRR